MISKRIHVIVQGRVQGVFFRDYTDRQAETLGLHGWVRNLPDRTVEAVFEGEPEKTAAMVAWLHAGSPQSSVVSVTVTNEEPCGETGFTIRY